MQPETPPEKPTKAQIPPGIQLLNVTAADKWQHTKLKVKATDVVAVLYESGKWSACPGHEHDASGFGGRTADSWVLPTARYGGLCAKVGDDGEPVFVGNASFFIAGRDGEVMLIINDDYPGKYGPGFADNYGAVAVWVWRR